MSFPPSHPALDSALRSRGYEAPTPVQKAVLEAAETAGPYVDLLVSAQTGSGKTVAFGLAMASSLLGTSPELPPASAPLALIIAPTRELAMQISRELAWLYACRRRPYRRGNARPHTRPPRAGLSESV